MLELDAAAPGRTVSLEMFVANLLATIPGFIVARTPARSRHGDVDAVLRNESSDRFLARLAGHILVEFKARQTPVDEAEVQALMGKLALRHSRTGMLFSISGFTRDATASASDAYRVGLDVVLFGRNEISRMVQADDRVGVLKNRVTQSMLA